ncbi:heat shock protein 9/12-domain-containing protein [Daedaleopsis nitida]|nr:heat shock protein 9/12-domain-containing protein [Daedaleopsis nitida]
MSDHGRQSLSDKTTAAIKPDSEKTTREHFGDKFKGNMDSAASTAQPENEKSYTQKAGDAFSGNSNEDKPSITQKAKNALGMGN